METQMIGRTYGTQSRGGNGKSSTSGTSGTSGGRGANKGPQWDIPPGGVITDGAGYLTRARTSTYHHDWESVTVDPKSAWRLGRDLIERDHLILLVAERTRAITTEQVAQSLLQHPGYRTEARAPSARQALPRYAGSGPRNSQCGCGPQGRHAQCAPCTRLERQVSA